ncbi:tRNA(His) guanylyltransferase Thg1 family protein [Haliangium sp.]|uniref:tRNA(His) guanylyltransferase Thg1 family protein n=1 Tax=Haliangium sp. TaxID=2663208 RepID=UPI003D107846
MSLHHLDQQMRAIESADDDTLPVGEYLIARLDGRGFGRLLGERALPPYDQSVRDHLIAAARALMQDSGFRALYAHVHGDEISLLVHPADRNFGRRRRKLLSILPALASAEFSLRLGQVACFDCRVTAIPALSTVSDYFFWRAANAERNTRIAYCRRALLAQGHDPASAAATLAGMSVDDKQALLSAHGVDFDRLPGWQRWGVGLYWEPYEVEVPAPVTGSPVSETRRRLTVVMALPDKDHYRDFVCAVVEAG